MFYRSFSLFGLLFVLIVTSATAEVRLKDLVDFDGVRGNDLLGYGLVVGLNGTGDSVRNSPFTEEIALNIFERLGVNVSGENIRPRNIAAVLVTAQLPPFSRTGSMIDINVAAVGDASSLMGGTLVMTPLSGADGAIYAVAQGSIIAGGISVEGIGAREVRGVPTSGFIPRGARVEREVDFVFSDLPSVRMALRNPDFSLAINIERAINSFFQRPAAIVLDPGTVLFDVSSINVQSIVHGVGLIENLRIQPVSRARVVVDQRTGTIVIGEDVAIGRVAVAQGGLSLRIDEVPFVVQPNPFATGETILVPRTRIEVDQEESFGFVEVAPAASLADLIDGLNALGVHPRDMIDILSSINSAGALHAELIVK
ncbi:MAG: flagellar basal body P-ring protein FlgI [Roseinatronobacter sp.]